jgi:hypothetical protein
MPGAEAAQPPGSIDVDQLVARFSSLNQALHRDGFLLQYECMKGTMPNRIVRSGVCAFASPKSGNR